MTRAALALPATLSAMVLPAFALAGDGLLGTKTSAPVNSGASAGGSLVQTVLAVIIVGAAIKFALPAIMKRFGAPLAHSSGHALKIEESAGFPGGHLHVVRAGGKRLLIGTTSNSVAMLSDLTETATPQGEDLPLFSEIVEGAPAFSPDLARRLDHLGNLR